MAPMPEDENGELPQGEDDDCDDPDEWRDYAEELEPIVRNDA